MHTETESPTGSLDAAEIAELRLHPSGGKPEGDCALAFVVERIRNSTRATAAAIALVDGDEIVCRASSGNAPNVGARVDPKSGLTGECVRTGEIVRCQDTETDPRADRLVCRSLDLRSIVIVPVRFQGRTAGILEVFSSRPHAFESGEELVLQHFADLVVEIAMRSPEPASPPSSHRMVAAPIVEPHLSDPHVDKNNPPSVKEILAIFRREHAAIAPPIAEKAEPVVEQPALRIVEKAEPVIERPAVATKPQPKCEPPAPLVTPAVPAAQPAPKPKAAKSEVAPAAIICTDRCDDPPSGSSTRELSFASLAAQWPMPQWLSPLRIRITAGVLVTVLVLGAWQLRRAMTSSGNAPVDTHIQQGQPADASAADAPARLLAVNTASAPAKSNAMPAHPKPAKRAHAMTLPPPDITGSAAPPAVSTLLEPPAGEASPISNLLAAPVASPQLDSSRVSQISGGNLIKKIDPVYPTSMAMGMHGEVVLTANINRKGQVTKVNVVSGQAALAQAAVAAVMRWRYQPFLLNGVPIEVESTIVLNFKAPGH